MARGDLLILALRSMLALAVLRLVPRLEATRSVA